MAFRTPCTQIFTNFSNLQYLSFDPSVSGYEELSFDMSSPPIVFSSTLLEFHVTVHCYEDCLYLFDGRFNQLHTFYIIIGSPLPRPLTIINDNVSYSYEYLFLIEMN